MAGCPFALGLSKLAMHPVMQVLWNMPELCHLDLYIDDSGYDVEDTEVYVVVQRALKIWRVSQHEFGLQNLPISVDKSAWVCSSRVEIALSKRLKPTDPSIEPIWRDLGIDCSGGKRRRVTIHKQPFQTASGRAKRLRQLKTPVQAAQKATRAGVRPCQLFGSRFSPPLHHTTPLLSRSNDQHVGYPAWPCTQLSCLRMRGFCQA